jgi:hypothetical protein
MMNYSKLLKTIFRVTGILAIMACNVDSKDENPGAGNGTESEIPEVPRINFIEMTDPQPQERDTSCIWYDDFDGLKTYLESSGDLDHVEAFGTGGGSMKAGFKNGEVNGEGNRKVAFGDFPEGSPVESKGKHFNEIFWRIYVKHEYGWKGAPAKMSRATSIVSANWQQAMIAHVWSGENNSLTLDPASGVKGQTDSIQTTGYNDFEHLTWLGNKPNSTFQISSTAESGYWVMVEASARLNTPGKSDGSCRLWIDGRLEAERSNLNFRGSYTKHGINAVFLESYWNEGAPKTEGRWYDNFVISTCQVGPVTCPANPVLQRTPYHGPESLDSWEVELAADVEGSDVVFRSGDAGREEKITINTDGGSFAGSLQGRTKLDPGATYFCRIRQKSTNGKWSTWSRWHQPFKVAVT